MKYLAFCFALFSASNAYAADKVTLILDWFVNPDHGPIIIAEENGYFADQGLDVEIIAPADPSDPPKLVVGTLVSTPLNCLLVKDDGPIESIADLKGKKIGFSVAGVEEAVLDAMFRPHGFGIDDVEMINVNWSLSPAVMSGQVDAVIGAFRNFELNQMEIEGVLGRCFYPEEEGLPAYDELIYVMKSDTLDKDVITRFLAATELAIQYMVNHPIESRDIFIGTSKELDDELNRRAWIDTLPRFALRPAALDAGRYARFESFLRLIAASSISALPRAGLHLPVSFFACLGARSGEG